MYGTKHRRGKLVCVFGENTPRAAWWKWDTLNVGAENCLFSNVESSAHNGWDVPWIVLLYSIKLNQFNRRHLTFEIEIGRTSYACITQISFACVHALHFYFAVAVHTNWFLASISHFLLILVMWHMAYGIGMGHGNRTSTLFEFLRISIIFYIFFF